MIKSVDTLYLMYHDPCLDGVYSMMGLMLPILEWLRIGKTVIDWCDSIIPHLEYLKKYVAVEQELKDSIRDDIAIEEKYFYVNDRKIIFIPIKLGDKADECQRVLKYIKGSQNSMLISIDYCGKSWEAMQMMDFMFRYVIIIDHHQTCRNELKNCSAYDYEKYRTLNYLYGNTYALVNFDKAGCQLAHDFHEMVTGKSYQSLLPHNMALKIQKFVKHVADNDLFILQYPETEAVQMSLMKLRLDYNIRNNPKILYRLMEQNFDMHLQNGKKLVEQRDIKVKAYMQQRKTFNMGNNAKGYAVFCQDLSVLNSLGAEVALIAMKSGDSNLAAIYHESKLNVNQYKIHFRSAHHDHDGTILNRYPCDILAEKYGGGGHEGAASIYMDKKKWLDFVF